MNFRPLKIYWAGDLFDAKDLGGNLMLADAIERVSQNRYRIMLPQDGECEVTDRTSQSIRDADFELLLACDCIIANFDGPDPDSGTIVEFCFAKAVDMPAVLLRTDFRNSGDHTLPDGEPWNLMCSHYPRTKVLHINGMMRYHECMKKAENAEAILKLYYESIAADAVAALDKVTGEKSWLSGDALAGQYLNTVKSIGGTLSERLETIWQDLIERKQNSGLYR